MNAYRNCENKQVLEPKSVLHRSGPCAAEDYYEIAMYNAQRFHPEPGYEKPKTKLDTARPLA